MNQDDDPRFDLKVRISAALSEARMANDHFRRVNTLGSGWSAEEIRGFRLGLRYVNNMVTHLEGRSWESRVNEEANDEPTGDA